MKSSLIIWLDLPRSFSENAPKLFGEIYPDFSVKSTQIIWWNAPRMYGEICWGKRKNTAVWFSGSNIIDQSPMVHGDIWWWFLEYNQINLFWHLAFSYFLLFPLMIMNMISINRTFHLKMLTFAVGPLAIWSPGIPDCSQHLI